MRRPPTRPTHPGLDRRTIITGLTGRAFGISVAGSGQVLVTERDVDMLMQLDSSAGGSSFHVSADPVDVITNRAGTVAYVSGFHDGMVTVIGLAAADTPITYLDFPTRNLYRLALSPNEEQLFATSTNGAVYAGDIATGRVAMKKTLSGSLQGMALDHARRSLYVGSSTGELWRLDPASLRVIQHAQLDCVVQDIALSIDDAELYVACDKTKGSVVVLDPKTFAPITTINLAGAAFGLAVTPDNAQIYVTMPALGGLMVIDRVTRTCVRGIVVQGAPRRIAFSPTGDKAYVSNEWNWVSVFE